MFFLNFIKSYLLYLSTIIKSYCSKLLFIFSNSFKLTCKLISLYIKLISFLSNLVNII